MAENRRSFGICAGRQRLGTITVVAQGPNNKKVSIHFTFSLPEIPRKNLPEVKKALYRATLDGWENLPTETDLKALLEKRLGKLPYEVKQS